MCKMNSCKVFNSHPQKNVVSLSSYYSLIKNVEIHTVVHLMSLKKNINRVIRIQN